MDLIGLLLLSIPTVFYNLHPMTGDPSSIFYKMIPSRKQYFSLRCVLTSGMAAAAYLVAGSFKGVWEIWHSYTESAVYIAYAVALAVIAYPLLFLAILYRYHRELVVEPKSDSEVDEEEISDEE